MRQVSREHKHNPFAFKKNEKLDEWFKRWWSKFVTNYDTKAKIDSLMTDVLTGLEHALSSVDGKLLLRSRFGTPALELKGGVSNDDKLKKLRNLKEVIFDDSRGLKVYNRLFETDLRKFYSQTTKSTTTYWPPIISHWKGATFLITTGDFYVATFSAGWAGYTLMRRCGYDNLTKKRSSKPATAPPLPPSKPVLLTGPSSKPAPPLALSKGLTTPQRGKRKGPATPSVNTGSTSSTASRRKPKKSKMSNDVVLNMASMLDDVDPSTPAPETQQDYSDYVDPNLSLAQPQKLFIKETIQIFSLKGDHWGKSGLLLQQYGICAYYRLQIDASLRHLDHWNITPFEKAMKAPMYIYEHCEVGQSTIPGAGEGLFLREGHPPVYVGQILGLYEGVLKLESECCINTLNKCATCMECTTCAASIVVIPGYPDKTFRCPQHQNEMAITDDKGNQTGYIIHGGSSQPSVKINHAYHKDKHCNVTRTVLWGGAACDIPTILLQSTKALTDGKRTELLYDYVHRMTIEK